MTEIQTPKKADEFDVFHLVNKYNNLASTGANQNLPETKLYYDLVEKYNKMAAVSVLTENDSRNEEQPKENVMVPDMMQSFVPGISSLSGKNFRSPDLAMSVKELAHEAEFLRYLRQSRLCTFEINGKCYTVCVRLAIDHWF